ncbi:MAG: glycosyltransferase family 39 protein [Phycisphaerales bacterium]|nr:glycosyltransferase family 39 protein [Phycisphaerales bacterium]
MATSLITSPVMAWLALLLSALFIGGAVWMLWRRRPLWALAAALAVGLLLRGYAGTRAYLHPWDERYHALVAKNLLQDLFRPTLYRDPALPYDFRDWQANHVWLHKPPLALWLMAGGIAMWGNTELGVRAPSIMLSLAGILLTYAIGRRLFSRQTAALAALLHAVNPLLIRLSVGQTSVDHVDALLVVLVQLAVWLGLGWVDRPGLARLTGVTLACGLAVLTKWLPGLLAAPVMAVFGSRMPGWRRSALAATAVCGGAWLLALPWERYAAQRFPQEHAHERAYNWRHLWEPLEGHVRSPLFQIAELHRNCGELVLLPMAWLALVTIRRPRPVRTAVLIWWLLPLMLFSLVATQRSNYMAVAMPALFLTAGHCWTWLRRTPLLRGRGRLRGVLLVALLALPIKDAATFVDPTRAHVRQQVWAEELKAQLAQVHGPRAVLFNTSRPIEAMFYGDVTAYAEVPEEQTAAALLQRGYQVHIIDSSELSPALRTLQGVRIIQRRDQPAPQEGLP